MTLIYTEHQVWIKPNGEMPFLYGNHIVKAHVGRVTEDIPQYQGVVVFNMNDIPLVSISFSFFHSNMCNPIQGFGVSARSSVDTKNQDPTAIIVFHQACVPLLRLYLFFYSN